MIEFPSGRNGEIEKEIEGSGGGRGEEEEEARELFTLARSETKHRKMESLREQKIRVTHFDGQRSHRRVHDTPLS